MQVLVALLNPPPVPPPHFHWWRAPFLVLDDYGPGCGCLGFIALLILGYLLLRVAETFSFRSNEEADASELHNAEVTWAAAAALGTILASTDPKTEEAKKSNSKEKS